MAWHGTITRLSAASPFEGVRLAGGESIGSVLGATAAVSDLSLGAWRANQVACELADQLGVTLASRSLLRLEPIEANERAPVPSGIIDRWVDAEIAGNPGVLCAVDHAHQLLDAVCGATERTFAVIAPRFGNAWGLQNTRFIEVFAEGLRQVGGRLRLIACEGDEVLLPRGWKVEWIAVYGSREVVATVPVDPRWRDAPGLVPAGAEPCARRGAASALALAGGLRLVLPFERQAPSTPWRSHPPLTPLEGAMPWVLAHQELDASTGRTGVWTLAMYAIECFNSADIDLSLRLATVAAERAAFPLPRGHIKLLLQAIQLGAHRYLEAASDEDRPRGVPEPLRDRWLRGRAYAAALSRHPALVKSSFAETRTYSASAPLTWEDLYARNLMALAELQEGRWDDARALQASIEKALDARPGREWHIRYLNALNTARLYRQRRLYAEAGAYYQRAFEILDGLRVEGDQVYVNFCLARQAEDQGLYEEFVLFWLRTCLHWAAMAVPEALGWRCAAGILGRKVDPEEVTVDAVTERLLARLRPLAADLELGDLGPEPTFLGSQTPGLDADPEPFTGVGSPGWCVFVRRAHRAAPYDGPGHRELRRLLWSVLRGVAGVPEDVSARTVVVDARFGCEIPGTRVEAMDVAARLGALRIVFDGEDRPLTEVAHAEWECRSTLRLGPGVVSIEPTPDRPLVIFRRIREPLQLSTEDMPLIEAASRGMRVGELVAARREEGVLERLRALERLHVLSLAGPENEDSFGSEK